MKAWWLAGAAVALATGAAALPANAAESPSGRRLCPAVAAAYPENGQTGPDARAKALAAAEACAMQDPALGGYSKAFVLLDSDPAQADPVLASVLAAKSDYAPARLARCFRTAQKGDAKAALADCDAAVTAEPAWAYALALRARIRAAAGDQAGATADYDAAVRADPAYADAYVARGSAKYAAGDAAGALLDFDTARRIAPERSDLVRAVAALLANGGSSDKAKTLLDEALKRSPRDADLLVDRAALESSATASLAFLDRAVSAAPQDAAVLNARATYRFKAGKKPEAEQDLKRAVQVAPGQKAIRLNLASVQRELKRPRDAVATIDAGLALAPADGDLLAGKADALAELKDWPAAVASAQAATAAAPDRYAPTAMVNAAGDAYAEPLTKYTEALDRADDVKRCGVDVGSWSYLSAVRTTGGDGPRAEAALAQATEKEALACLAERSASAERVPEVRAGMVEAFRLQTAAEARLTADCARSAGFAAACDAIRGALAERRKAAGTRAQKVETDLLAARADAEKARSGLRSTVLAAIAKTRADILTDAADDFADATGDLAALQRAASEVRSASYLDLSSCSAPSRSFIMNEPSPDPVNEAVGAYWNCLRGVESRAGDQQSRLGSYRSTLSDAADALIEYAPFRCSLSPGSGCVPDELWNRVNAIRAGEARDVAASKIAAADQLQSQQIRAELERMNALITERDRTITAQNRSQAVGNFLGAVAAGVAAGSQQTYRPDTSTSAPGIK